MASESPAKLLSVLGSRVAPVCLLLMTLLWPHTSPAQTSFPKIGWRPGQWAAYRLIKPNGQVHLIEIGISGWKRIQGREFFWLELRSQEEGQTVIIKQLLHPNGENRQTIIQKGKHSPLKLKAGSWVRFDHGFGTKDIFRYLNQTEHVPGPRIKLVGWAIKQVVSYQGDWYAPEVPIMGLVRAKDPKLGRLTLLAHGYSAYRSHIKGQVRDISIPFAQPHRNR